MPRVDRNPYRPGTASHEEFRREQLNKRLRKTERGAGARSKSKRDRAQLRKLATYLRRELRILPAREAASRRRAELSRARRTGRLPAPPSDAPIEAITPSDALSLLRAELKPYERSRLDTLSRDQQLAIADIYRRFPAGPPPKPGQPGGVALHLSGFEWWLLYRAYGFPKGVS